MKRFAILLLAAMLLPASIAYSGNIDTFGVGAKDTAPGGAFSAKADNFSAMYYNPAGLVQIKRPEISFGGICDPAYQFSVIKGSRILPMDASENLNSSYGSDALGKNPQASAKGKGVICSYDNI